MNIEKISQTDTGKGMNSGVKYYLAIVRKMVQFCISFDSQYSKNLIRHVEFVPESIYQSNGEIHMIELLARFPGPLSTGETLVNIRNKGDTFLLFQKALAHAYSITSSARRCQVSINVDILDFRDNTFMEYINKMVAKYSRNSTKLITFEILENPDLTGIDDSMITILHSLKNLGYKIALDDLAMSQSKSEEGKDEKRNYSMEYLMRLSETNILDYLKIDGITVEHILSYHPTFPPGSEEFISLIQSYHSQGVYIIAEWIHSEYEAISLTQILDVPLLFQGRLLRPGFNPIKTFKQEIKEGPISGFPLS